MEYKDFFNNADSPEREDRESDGYAPQPGAEGQGARPEWTAPGQTPLESEPAGFEVQGARSEWTTPDQSPREPEQTGFEGQGARPEWTAPDQTPLEPKSAGFEGQGAWSDWSAPKPTPREPERPRVYGKVSGQNYDASGVYYASGDAPSPEPASFGVDPSSVFGAKRADGPDSGGANAGYSFSDASSSGGYDAPPAAAVAATSATVGVPLYDRRRFGVLVAVIIVAMLASGVLGGVIGSNMKGNSVPASVAGSATGENINILASSDMNTTEAVAQKVLDSVVGITSTMTVEGGNYFGFNLGSQESGGVGTGIIVDASGYILTNSHVVLDGKAEKIEVLLSDGSTVQGNLLWNDSSIDLAIVKVDATGKTLKPAELGDSDKVRIGSYVAAIGNPLGLDFNGSITQGVVSGLGRSITATDGTKSATMEGLIQVDAAINSGNSGGPLLDKNGKVIGVNTAKAQAEGMGFAIPINTAKPIVDKVIKTGGFERVYMGVSAADASVIAEQYPNLGINKDEKGAFITAVSGDSPADNAGLKMKDVITSVDGKKIETSSDLIKVLLNYSAGDEVKVVYLRDGKEGSVNVTLGSQADVYGEWNNGSADTTENGGGNQNPLNPNEESPADPFGGGGDPFGDW
ncbi:MAG: trypsin-like peptidase domain-containing protein [Clostridiales Family XIII bacterium]|jgi:S1-C subfamily serine protease|nr:trypsin-like peptidase domain-containing protein [Clostridiales Family XIII bacterium]